MKVFVNKNNVFLVCFAMLVSLGAIAQGSASLTDPEAAKLLKASSEKYKQLGALRSDFTLTIVRPKAKPDEPDSKYTEVQQGKIWLKENAFKVQLGTNEIICNGKDIWTYLAKSKECQLNEFIESDEVFSPAKIFNLYKSDFSYQLKETKTVGGKTITVIEMLPANKKVSYFKIDVSLNDAHEITEVKVYEKNGVRYFYKPQNTLSDKGLSAAFFSFDAAKHPGVHIEDLR